MKKTELKEKIVKSIDEYVTMLEQAHPQNRDDINIRVHINQDGSSHIEISVNELDEPSGKLHHAGRHDKCLYEQIAESFIEE